MTCHIRASSELALGPGGAALVNSSFDAIVIGAGHNGLTLAIYLQRAGLQTLVLERASRAGGMSRTDEPLLAGYRHSPHANLLSYYDLMPMVTDFTLGSQGVRTVSPEAQHGICFSDGRPPLILYRSDQRERTRASLARYSARDAAIYCALAEEIDAVGQLLREGLYAPARRKWFERQADTLNRATARIGLRGTVGRRSARAVIDEFFETSEVRTLFYQLAAEFGAQLDEPGGDLSFLGVVLWVAGRWRLPLGGMQSLPDALHRVAEREGVHIALRAEVTRMEVSNGRIQGVYAPAIGQVRAERIVASSCGLVATLLGLVGPEELSPEETKNLGALAAMPVSTLGSLMYCLTEPPDYRSARWDPDINRCLHTIVGFDSPEDILANARSIEAGQAPLPAAAMRVNTLWDKSLAPRGMHVAGGDAPLPSPKRLEEAAWRDLRASHANALLDRWRDFAPNMTRDRIVACGMQVENEYERFMRFRLGPDQYRTEISGLYLCGSSTYPGGGVHGACAYNAYQAIAADHDLESLPPASPLAGA